MRPITFPISEIFGPTLQGEGPLAGTKTHFIRTEFCDGANGGGGWCSWCDSMYAVDPLRIRSALRTDQQWLSAEQIFERVDALPPADWVTITGGNPLIYNLQNLVELLQKQGGMKVAVETQGTIYRLWMNRCHSVIVSPKPPSAGSKWEGSAWAKLRECVFGSSATLKVVVANRADLEFAREVRREFPTYPFYLSLCTRPGEVASEILARWRWLAQEVLEDPAFRAVAVLPQLHVLLWGHGRGR